MSLVLADRVAETSATTGTGSVTLAGAIANHVGFDAAVGVGNTTYYALVSRTPVTQWEVGLGTLSGATALDRTMPLATWDGTTLNKTTPPALNFSAGIKDVFVTLPASLASVIGGGATSIIGTAGQITASAPTGAVTLSLPNPLTPPGTLAMGSNPITFTDATLLRDGAANILAQRNSTSAQIFRLYNTWTDASNGEWVELNWAAAANTPILRAAMNGSGVARVLTIAYPNTSTAAVMVPAAVNGQLDLARIGVGATNNSGGTVRIGGSANFIGTTGTGVVLNVAQGVNVGTTSTLAHVSVLIGPTINYSAATPGAGSYTALKVAVTEQNLPTGQNYIIQALAGAAAATAIFSVTNKGVMALAGVTFATLGTPVVGTMAYCSDCDAPAAGIMAICTSAGAKTGAWAFRVNTTPVWGCIGV